MYSMFIRRKRNTPTKVNRQVEQAGLFSRPGKYFNFFVVRNPSCYLKTLSTATELANSSQNSGSSVDGCYCSTPIRFPGIKPTIPQHMEISFYKRVCTSKKHIYACKRHPLNPLHSTGRICIVFSSWVPMPFLLPVMDSNSVN